MSRRLAGGDQESGGAGFASLGAGNAEVVAAVREWVEREVYPTASCTPKPGTVGCWWVKASSIDEASVVTERINKAFLNTSAEVRAETERAFQLSFISMWANIKTLIGGISIVVIFALLLVTVSTMSMAIRERFRELAVLKALGFRRGELFALILGESFGLAGLGGLFGVGGAWALFRAIDIQKATNGMFLVAEVTPGMIGLAFGIVAGLGFCSAVVPMISVARTSVVQGLKTLD